MRKIWIAAIAGLLATPGLAHDFWLQPRSFISRAPGPVALDMYVGHGSARERWGVARDRVLLFRTIGPDGMVDRKSGLTLGSAPFDAVVPFRRLGSYIVLLQSASSPSQLPFLRFNEYVADEGITPIANQRRRLRQERKAGREIYSRRAKAIVQVGPIDAASAARVTRPVNLRLEIVPERHPLALGPDRRLPVKVLFDGRPLPGALVKITNLARDAKPAAMQRSGRDGRATFIIPRAGRWQMNVVWAVPLINDRRADFETIFSSLTFATAA